MNGSSKDLDFLTEKQREVLELARIEGTTKMGEITFKQLLMVELPEAPQENI